MSDKIHPIIYVRGYAISRGEIDDTAADPFCVLNPGSTIYRATPEKNKPAKKSFSEWPVIRLHSDFGYIDVFENELDIMDEGGCLFRDTIILEITPAQDKDERLVPHHWQNDTTPAVPVAALPAPGSDKLTVSIPFSAPQQPGISGIIRFVVSPWNVLTTFAGAA